MDQQLLSTSAGSGLEGTTTPPATLEQLLLPVLSKAYGLALRLTRNAADAEDAVQEAALQATKAFGSFTQGTNFKAWFFRIVTNCVYAKYRRTRRETHDVHIDATPELFLYIQTAQLGMHLSETNPAQAFLGRLDTEQIVAALETLPEEYRTVSTLYLMDDLAYEEIASILGIPVGTVRSRLHRGRKILQKALWQIAQDHGIIPEKEKSVS